MAAPKIPGGILVMVGDTMQMWTGDRLKACMHRVVAGDETTQQTVRQTMTFFGHPDHGVRIAPLDGSDKYPPFVAPFHAVQRRTHDGGYY